MTTIWAIMEPIDDYDCGISETPIAFFTTRELAEAHKHQLETTPYTINGSEPYFHENMYRVQEYPLMAELPTFTIVRDEWTAHDDTQQRSYPKWSYEQSEEHTHA
jgi:hypothetical protein